MGEWFADFFDWMEALPVVWAYVALLAIAFGENVVPPIPGDMAVVFGGYLVGVGRLDFALVVVLATLGGAAGFMTMYALGRRIGDAVLDPERLQWLPKEQIGKARAWLSRWGYGVIAANRFLSGARSVISLTVGMARMDPAKTAFFATLSAAVWTFLIAYAGLLVGENWSVIGDYLRTYGQVMLVVLGVFVAFQVLRWYRNRRRASGEAPR